MKAKRKNRPLALVAMVLTYASIGEPSFAQDLEQSVADRSLLLKIGNAPYDGVSMTRPMRKREFVAAFGAQGGHSTAVDDLDAQRIGQIIGVAATTTPDGVVKVGWARSDVPVKIDGLAFRPYAGLGSWAAFQATEKGAMLMGDTVVFEDEVNAAIDAAFTAGLEVTALHNHFFYDQPKVYFMHIGGSGPPEALATGVKSVWDAIKASRADNPHPSDSFPGAVVEFGELSSEPLSAIIGATGEVKDGVFKIVIGRKGQMHGVEFGGSMGLTTWMAFSGSDAQAIVCGDFAMTDREVQPVLHALRAAQINIVALHNHMIGDEPNFIFVHFWGKGPAADLATRLRSTLDAQKTVDAEPAGKMKMN